MSLLQSLDEELMCAVCLEFYETPLLLPCGHNFCKNCLISISESALGPVNSLSCPVCKASISLRKTAISQLLVNRVLENIISLYKANSPVDVFDCAWNSDVDIQVTTCPSHNHPADRYCEVCNIAICTICMYEAKHSSKTQGRHHVVPLKRIATKYQAEIANSLAEIKMKNVPLNDRIQQLQERLDGVDKNEETIVKQLTEDISSVMSAVRQRQEALSHQLQTNVADMKRPIVEQMTRCRGVKTLIQEFTKKLSAIKKTKDAGLKIRLMKNARKQLDLLLVDLLLAVQPQTAPQVATLTWQLSTRSFLDKLGGLHWEKRGVPESTVVNAATQTMDEPDDTSDYNPRENASLRHEGHASPKLPTSSATDIKPELENTTVSVSDVAIPFNFTKFVSDVAIPFSFTKLFINNSPPQVTISSVGDSLTPLGNTTTAATANSTSSSVSSEPANKSLTVTTAAASNPGELESPKISFSISRNTSSRNSPTLSFNTTDPPTSTLQTALVTSSSQSMDTQSGDSDRFSTCSESSISHQPVAGEVNENLERKVVGKLSQARLRKWTKNY